MCEEPASRRHALHRSLAERSRRMDRLKAAGTPEVGRFDVIADTLQALSIPMPAGKEEGEDVVGPLPHCALWPTLVSLLSLWPSLPEDSHPRGRVVDAKATATYDVEVAPELMAWTAILQHIMTDLHLPPAQTGIRPDDRSRGQQEP